METVRNVFLKSKIRTLTVDAVIFVNNKSKHSVFVQKQKQFSCFGLDIVLRTPTIGI